MRTHLLSTLPYPAQVIAGWLIYRKSTQTLHGQGTGRFSADEIASFRQQIWEAVCELLVASKQKRDADEADAPFWVMGGDGPSEADMALFGFVVAMLVCTAYVTPTD